MAVTVDKFDEIKNSLDEQEKFFAQLLCDRLAEGLAEYTHYQVIIIHQFIRSGMSYGVTKRITLQKN